MIGARVKINKPRPSERHLIGTITKWSPSGVWCWVQWDGAGADRRATSRLIEVDDE